MEIFSERKSFQTIRSFRFWAGLKKWGEWFVIGGIVGEIFTGALTAIHEKQIEKMADTRNKPITQIRANLSLFVRGERTNVVVASVDPVKDEEFVALDIGNRAWMESNHVSKVRLICKTSEQFKGSDDNEWQMEFDLPPGDGSAWNLTPNDTVGSADAWNLVLFHAFFLRNNVQITRGELSLRINSEVKHFQIPPQRAVRQSVKYSEIKLIGGISTNGVEVIVLPD